MLAAIILAAGSSSRMGEPKQLLNLTGQPVICHLVKQVMASRFGLIRVVIGAYAEEIIPLLTPLGVEMCINPDYARGQSTSVKVGLEGISAPIEGAAFILADQPLTTVETYNHLIEVFLKERPGIVLPTYHGQRGNPIIFHQKFFPQLSRLIGDRGGREIIKAHPEEIRRVEIDDPGIILDIDYPEDYHNICQHFKDGESLKEI